MKKTITANISGSVFHIEEDAYEQLNAYLNSIRGKFDGSPDADEIIADIEGRIAELFLENKRSASEVVTTIDVGEVIQTMGSPEDYLDEEEHTKQRTDSRQSKERGNRKLYRDPDDRWLGGVMSGIAAYFDTSVLTLRLLLILSLFLGLPLIAYIIAWIIVPKATTNAEKLEMRGEAVTVDNIKRMFEDGVDAVERGAKKFASKAENLGKEVRSGKPGNGVDRFFSFLGDTFQYLFKAIGKIFGFFFVVFATVILTGILVLTVGKFNFVWDGLDLMQGGNIRQMSSMIFESSSQAFWMAAAVIAGILVPAIWLLAAGLRLLRKDKRVGRWPYLLLPIWIMALIVTGVIGSQLGFDFRKEVKVRSTIEIEQPLGEVLTISAAPDEHFGGDYHGDGPNGIKIDGGVAYMDFVQFDTEQSPDTLFHLKCVQLGHGSNSKEARQRAKNIDHFLEQNGNTLSIAPYFSIPVEDKFRAQALRFTLQVPIGKAIYLDESSIDVIYDIDNVFDTRDHKMMGHTWTMTKRGLSNAVSPEEVPNVMPRATWEESTLEPEEQEEEKEDEEVIPGPVVYTPAEVGLRKFNMPMLFGQIR